jgi:hypothetical protein
VVAGALRGGEVDAAPTARNGWASSSSSSSAKRVIAPPSIRREWGKAGAHFEATIAQGRASVDRWP